MRVDDIMYWHVYDQSVRRIHVTRQNVQWRRRSWTLCEITAINLDVVAQPACRRVAKKNLCVRKIL